MNTMPASPPPAPQTARTLGRVLSCTALLGMLILARAASAASATPRQLLERLREGGYVLVMRHAQSPMSLPDAASAEPDNAKHERQLSDRGKAEAQALGTALHTLGVRVGPIYSSPTYRAVETVRLAGLSGAQPVAELAEGPHGMTGHAARAQVDWLREAIGKPPPAGSNTLIVTHTPNIVGAFGAHAAHTQAGEMLVFHPQQARGRFIGRITIGQWRALEREGTQGGR